MLLNTLLLNKPLNYSIMIWRHFNAWWVSMTNLFNLVSIFPHKQTRLVKFTVLTSLHCTAIDLPDLYFTDLHYVSQYFTAIYLTNIAFTVLDSMSLKFTLFHWLHYIHSTIFHWNILHWFTVHCTTFTFRSMHYIHNSLQHLMNNFHISDTVLIFIESAH